MNEALPICKICGEPADEATDYTTALTCSYWGCGEESKTLYHTECVGDYQRHHGIAKGTNTGFLCPRGNAKAEIDKENPCRGKIQATHHRLPGKKKKQPPAPPPPVPAYTPRPAPAPKPKGPKPQNQGPPQPQKMASKEQIQRQVMACRQATQATQGDSVQERLRGGTHQPSIIPGMEFEEKKKKPAKKKHKSSKQAAANGAPKDGPLSRPINLEQLPDIMHQANGDKKFINDVNRYKALIGSQYDSDLSDAEEEEEESSYDAGTGSHLGVSVAASEAGSYAARDPWTATDPPSSYSAPSQLAPVPASAADGKPPAAHGVITWGELPNGADAVFDFGSLNIDFAVGVPEEIIAYMAELPDELSELYLNQLSKHMSGLHEANKAMVAEQQRQLDDESLQMARRLQQEEEQLLAAQQQREAQARAEALARQQQEQARQQQERAQALAQAQAAQLAQQQLLQRQQLEQAQAEYARYQQQQQQQQQMQAKQASAPTPATQQPASSDAQEDSAVDDLLALCLGEGT